jgi:CBS-domain-containing membrane protein
VPRVGPDTKLGDLRPVIGSWELAVVVADGDVVIGVVRSEATGGPETVDVADVMQAAPATVRPSIPRRELIATMNDDGQQHVLVTTPQGVLLGLVRLEDLLGR